MTIFYTIMTFTVLKSINDQHSMIASSNYYLNPLKFEFNSNIMANRLNSFYNKNLKIIVITDKIDTISAEKIGNSLSNNFIIYFLPSKEFFLQKRLEEIFSNKEINHTIFMFEKLDYKMIISNFAIFNIMVSGGSNSKKHILSPVQLKLARFILAISDSSGSDVADSFHFNAPSANTKTIDWTNKKTKIILSKLTDEFKLDYMNNYNKLEVITNKIPSTQLEGEDTQNINPSSTNSIPSSASDPVNEEEEYRATKSDLINTNLCVQKREFNTFSFLKTEDNPTSISIINYPVPAIPSNTSPISFYLNYIKDIINNPELTSKEAQSKIENIWINLIEERFKDNNYLIKNHSSKLQFLIFEAHKTLDILEKRKIINRKFPLLALNNNLNRIEFLLLTFVFCITYSNRLSYTAISRAIGDNIIFTLFKKSKYTYYKEYKNSINYTEDLYIKLGDFYITLLTQYPHDIFERKFHSSSYYTKESATLNINPVYLDEIRNNIMINPYTLPMLCEPNLWAENSFGGYLENKSKEVSIITGNTPHNHKIEDKDSLFKAINYLNSIRFGINNLVLDYLNNEGKYLLDSIKPDNDLQREITLKVAQLLSKIPFYLNTQADWRGRIYTQSFFITYQGGDLSSSLINFWEGKTLTDKGKYYLYIHGANNHNEENISKESFENRFQWVIKNYDKIINLDKSLILSAEKPFIFLAFSLNMRELHNNPKAVIKTPVFLDATCSGIQHLSALLLDSELGILVNLSPYKQEDKPNDIYSEILVHINKAINKFGEQNIEHASFSLLKLTRGDIKTSIMTKVYNVSLYGIAKQLESKFKNTDLSVVDTISLELTKSLQKNKLNKKNKSNDSFFNAPGKYNKPVILNKKDIFKIASIINEQIFVIFPSLNNIFSYFLEMAKIMINLDIPISWITPAGIKITQHYLKTKQSFISTKLFNETKKLVIKEYLDKTDNVKQTNAIIPNIIHSLDATHLINLINSSRAQRFEPIITIHDCFGTHPNNMGELAHRVRKEFILLYSQENFLETFHNRLIQSIKDNNFEIIFNEGEKRNYILFNDKLIKIPNIPKLGELDLQKIIESKYMIT